MKRMSRKGITIVELVVVIIILILLSIIAIFNTNKTMVLSEGMAYKQEFTALYQALANLQMQYNLGDIEYTEGEHYYSSFEDPEDNNNTWYTVYGLNNYDQAGYSDKIIENLGLDELKRSYEFRLYDNKAEKDDIAIRFMGNDYVEIGGYKVKTYEDIVNLMNCGAI